MSEAHEHFGGYGIADALRDARREQESLLREKESVEASLKAGTLDAASGAARLRYIGDSLLNLALEIGILRAAVEAIPKPTIH